jgi:hypothetical protein
MTVSIINDLRNATRKPAIVTTALAATYAISITASIFLDPVAEATVTTSAVLGSMYFVWLSLSDSSDFLVKA